MTAATRAIHLEVPTDALATFDTLARRLELSRPRLFARLMAIQAQQLRLEDDLARLSEERPTAEGASVAEWVRDNGIGLDE